MSINQTSTITQQPTETTPAVATGTSPAATTETTPAVTTETTPAVTTGTTPAVTTETTPAVTTGTTPAVAPGTQSVVVVTLTSSQADAGQTQAPVIVTMFSTVSFTPTSSTRASATATTSTVPVVASTSQSSDGALGTKGTIAVAVAVPVGVLVIAALLGAFLWRRRRRNRHTLAQRKEEADQYSFHPNESVRPTGVPALGATPVATQFGTRTEAATPYRGWQPTAMRQASGDQVTKLNSMNNLSSHRASGIVLPGAQGRDTLETPTLPAFAGDDLDSVVADSPHEQHSLQNGTRSQTSPGNGSPPLDALLGGQLERDASHSSEYSEAERDIPRSNSNRAPYPIDGPADTGMSAFMPALQSGSQRTPNVHRQSGNAEDARRYSYSNF